MPGLPVIMNETHLEIPPSKARMTVCRAPGQRSEVGAEGRGIT